MQRPRIVTVVPFFNRRRTVLAALASVTAQTRPTDRLIVVDDGSTDDGASSALEWLRKLPGRLDWQLIVQENGGVSSARNRGLALTTGDELIAFLDSDDVWPVDFLARTSSRLCENPRAVAVSCDRRFEFADGRPPRWRDSAGIGACPALWMLAHGANIASCTLFRSAALRRHSGFDARLRTGEDGALFMPVSLDGPWLHAPGSPVTFRHGEAELHGEHGNLSFGLRGNRRLWAALQEDFFLNAGRHQVARPGCRRLLAQAWYQAACELVDQSAPAESLACFRKAIGWHPWRAKYYHRLFRAWRRSWFERKSHDRAASTPRAPALHVQAATRA